MKFTPIILMVFIAALFSSCNSKVAEDEAQPNILFFLIDDQRDDVLSCAGHPIVKTPTVDMLAENGVRFTNSFVTTSICAASRASILTGLYEAKHNYTFGKPPVIKEFMTQSYPYVLRKSGYSTGFIGKFGIKIEETDSMMNAMFDYLELSPRSVPHFVKLPDGSRRHSSEIKGDQAIEFINMQTDDKPFCLSVSFNAVHAVDGNFIPGNEGHYPYPEAVAHLYEGMEMPAPRLSDPEIFENHPDFLKESFNRVRYHWRWDTEEKYQINMRAYLRMISGYDNVMKRVIDALKEKGLDKNTIIIFAADNGYYMGDRGFAGKWSHYEESLRVPLVIYDPRLPAEKRGKLADKIALNIDIPSTILDYAGVSIPEIYQGRSLVPVVENEVDDNWRENFFCEHRMDNPNIPKWVGLHDGRYVYAKYYGQDPVYEYLHDLEKDSDQLVNFVQSPEYAEILERMREETVQKEMEIKGN